ncbi:hypothetical protein M438DRAFT_169639 [Aureobasidium pullulans EXF-150]|uniref:Uncharacterized protein n=1 Tax=Aureobasidium pullulans EXF-150 TaxID=1043002 RepID=A0A074XVK4_AURPU|nr:uncharacterized protein M438DRAFT_169639 [Aureobasidium pullulans EXF-150]KEQ78686.1 hypothetical protein M438DRAFT_169639 [Aureobasidium pullulans EXF-150]
MIPLDLFLPSPRQDRVPIHHCLKPKGCVTGHGAFASDKQFREPAIEKELVGVAYSVVSLAGSQSTLCRTRCCSTQQRRRQEGEYQHATSVKVKSPSFSTSATSIQGPFRAQSAGPRPASTQDGFFQSTGLVCHHRRLGRDSHRHAPQQRTQPRRAPPR